jgi:hypothetical protein
MFSNMALGRHLLRAALILCFLIAVGGSLPLNCQVRGDNSSVPYDQDYGPGPSFHNLSTARTYSGSHRSIHEIDFRNLAFYVFDENGKSERRFMLENGKREIQSRTEIDTVILASLHYLPSSGEPKREYALVLFEWFAAAGSSGSTGIAQVFEVLDHRLRMVQQVDWDQHFDAGAPYESFNQETRTLVFRSAHYLPGDAHCCVSAMDVVTLHWDGTRFVQTAMSTELSEYGKSQGKTLADRAAIPAKSR